MYNQKVYLVLFQKKIIISFLFRFLQGSEIQHSLTKVKMVSSKYLLKAIPNQELFGKKMVKLLRVVLDLRSKLKNAMLYLMRSVKGWTILSPTFLFNILCLPSVPT